MTDSEALEFPSAESSDREGETFEDAPDRVSRPTLRSQHSRKRSNASVRSLMDRPSSAASVRSLTDRRLSSSSNATPRVSRLTPPMPNSVDLEDTDEVVSPNGAPIPEEERTKSPLLTARRISTFDEVQLNEIRDNAEARGRSTTTSSDRSNVSNHSRSSHSTSRPKLPHRTTTPSGPPLAAKNNILSSTASRKLSSPFTWLSRKKPAVQDGISPPPPSLPMRHQTPASFLPASSNAELLLNRLDEEHTDGSSSGSRIPVSENLRDRFKLLRMRDEAGIISLDAAQKISSGADGGALAGLIGRGSSVGLGIGSPTSVNGEGGTFGPPDLNSTTSPTSIASRKNSLAPVTSRSNSLARGIDPNLAPGTVSGASAGPSAMKDPEIPVDWDLWQSVVYEGPVAVAKTSADELTRAIANGIPSAIRGVVWQVLSQSKNHELEDVYRDLLVRGTDKDRDSPVLSSGPHSANSLQSYGKEKESIPSSASSIHSESSTPATYATNGMTSPSPSQDMDAANTAKLHSAMMAERQKRTKEDTATLKKLEKTIRKDLGARTNYSKYTAAAGLQEPLYGVCKAYALFDDGVGYAQGMNFIIMPLLFNMPEEEAFCLLVRLMNQYHLRDMFIQDMPGLHLHLYQFERLLEDVEPALCSHLRRRGITPQLYATQWFLTLFAYKFPLQLVLRVYDMILSEGLEGAILKFGVALMQKNAEALLRMQDMSSLKVFLNDRLFDAYIDQAPSTHSILESGFFGSSGGIDKEVYRADALVQDAYAVKITPGILKSYTTEWEIKILLEKQREAELDILRSTNASLALKVRSLEERAEKSDTEHVQMATEMIRTKVENEELRDVNESLKGHVDEMKVLVEKQPEEVEAKLKDEMERIMQRNIEVQNENRALEEQLADMEKELVDTKMQFAETNSQHDALKQRWSDLRKALGD